MTFDAWISEVLRTANARGIDVIVTTPRAGEVRFEWACRNGANRGSAGADASLARLTSVSMFMTLWTCPITPQAPSRYTPAPTANVPAGPVLEAWQRRGVCVPRIPAMAVAEALQALL